MEYAKAMGRFDFDPPESVIFCYQTSLVDHILDNHETTDTGCSGGLRILNETHGRIGIMGRFGVGAPLTSMLLEELTAFGVKKFISIGTAGSLQEHIEIGDIVVCDRAIRDEGLSHHYLPDSKYAYPSGELTEKIKDSLDKLEIKYHTGPSWSTDAVYRETIAEIKHYQEEGVATVEMETSALFSVAEYRGVQIGAIFTISDSLAELKWKPGFHMKETRDGLELLFKAALNALESV